MTKTEMMDMMITTRGLEDAMTIWFCKLCEKTDNLLTLNVMFDIAINAPM